MRWMVTVCVVAEAAEVVSTAVGTSVATKLTELTVVCSQKPPEIRNEVGVRGGLLLAVIEDPEVLTEIF